MKKIALLLSICMLLLMVPASLAQELAEEVETVSVGGGDEVLILDVEDDGDEELVTEFTGELDISAFVDEALENEVVELPEAVSVPERTGSDGEDNGEGGSGEAVESCADDEHVWDDGGKCTVCGYKCQHPNKSIREKTGEDFYQQIEGNNLSHILRWKVYDVGYCPDCNMNFGPDNEHYESEIEAHVYNEEGVCEYCNYLNGWKDKTGEPVQTFL